MNIVCTSRGSAAERLSRVDRFEQLRGEQLPPPICSILLFCPKSWAPTLLSTHTSHPTTPATVTSHVCRFFPQICNFLSCRRRSLRYFGAKYWPKILQAYKIGWRMFYPELSPAMRWQLEQHQKMYSMYHSMESGKMALGDQYGKILI